MAASDIIDLDILRPRPRIVKIGGHEVNVAFIPCGITFEVDKLVQEISNINRSAEASGEVITSGGEGTRRAFDAAIELCSLFCRREHPEMDAEWFRTQTDAQQVGIFTEAIKDALIRSYEGVDQYQRNPPRARRKRGTATEGSV